ncbi:iron chelate uptake ABC transporter family permease subunit [Polymorphospora sp. NPDC051019]|uniref:FecCD family ABC transporter permease n=1 Tax=Polymorphospora sp. NPDC051019 TaxID=3155725 RepID=UPI00344A23AF
MSAPATVGPPPLWPRRVRVLSLGDSYRLRIDTRVLTVGAVLAAVAVGVAAWSLTVGQTELSPAQIWAALTGQGETTVRRTVVEWRLPRVLMAVLGGAALALSGALFQTLTRNPLGSPDIIGFNTGAYTGALLSGVLVGGSYLGTIVGALLGGLGTGLLVWALAMRRGLQGYRLIVVGIGVSALLAAVNAYLLITLSLEQAAAAAMWGAGSLDTTTWSQLVPVALALLLLAPVTALLGRGMGLLPLGDDAAIGRGLDAGRLRVWLLLVGVTFTAVVTAVAGPISFVALLAPQLAVRLTRTPHIPLACSALMGAVLLTVSDLVARTVIAPTQLPVGVVTVVLGGVYLVWLLAARTRKA